MRRASSWRIRVRVRVRVGVSVGVQVGVRVKVRMAHGLADAVADGSQESCHRGGVPTGSSFQPEMACPGSTLGGVVTLSPRS